MAQAATMGPPLSPRETRRSGRRSAPSASASTSKSPDSPASESATRTNQSAARPALSNNTSNGRTKRPKQEDLDDSVPHKNAQSNGSASNHGNSNGRAKRRGKDKDKGHSSTDQVIDSASTKLSSSTNAAEPQEEDAEEQGITRCVCGMNEDDAEGGEFMVQCETCNVWQHGLCMGFDSEAQLAGAADYYCEQCKPERHQELFRRLAKKARESSTHSRNTTSRLSRSHSPSHLLKPPKRRNTMNSRDAAFDESLKEIIEATAAEAAAATDPPKSGVNGSVNGEGEVHDDDPSGRKKRKRGEEDVPPSKRTRSASSASDRPEVAVTVVPEELPPPPPKRASGGTAKSANSRNRRGGGGSRKAAPAIIDAVISVEGDEAPGPSKRSAQNNRKAVPAPKRPPPSSHASGSVIQEHSNKRNHSGGGTVAGGSAENSRAYRNSHAYAVSQQPLFTSWNLPDYLAHLEHMLPTDIPRPLEVRGSGVGLGGRESMERAMERGVKVKWPSKRMSVGDMNKRVRALVEWVGREQAGALDRGRRREALEKALQGIAIRSANSSIRDDRDAGGGGGDARGSPMVLDNTSHNFADSHATVESTPLSTKVTVTAPDSKASQSTMKMMEELMEELISFQERFGPGIKSRERERRPAS
ncbi:hypothetical protein HYDPIDRAFT_107334 [Hydnomerulius pinastri MD-312]|nr:hypothetical protein HYDPIDRAFT_107334 [Hydnomerulius pinastri MD-312]